MTTAQTTQATETTKEQLEEQLKNVNASIDEMNKSPTPSKGINWGSVAKTTGIFVGGAVVGAAGKWAWDHFFG